jgi:hypothetical protein
LADYFANSTVRPIPDNTHVTIQKHRAEGREKEPESGAERGGKREKGHKVKKTEVAEEEAMVIKKSVIKRPPSAQPPLPTQPPSRAPSALRLSLVHTHAH